MEFSTYYTNREERNQWVNAESGNIYLCPAGALKDPESASEEELMKYCVSESENPQND